MYYVYEKSHAGNVNVWFARNARLLCETAQLIASPFNLEVNGLGGIDEVGRAWSQLFRAHRIYEGPDAVRAGIKRGEVCAEGAGLLLHWVDRHTRIMKRDANGLVLQ